MSTVKKRLAMLVVMILIVSLPLGSLVFAENQSSGTDSIQICQTYIKNINSLKRDEATIVINGDGTATVNFETTMNCVEVTFSDYTYVSQPKPYEDQVLFDSETLHADTPGHYSITIDLPLCGKAQLDLYMGPVQEQLKPETGHDFMIKYDFYDAGVCTTPSPSDDPEPTPSDDPDPTPSDDPEPTPSDDPEPTPSDDPEPTPSDDPEPTPSDDPEPTPSDDPEPTPSDDPEPTPSDDPEPTPSDDPEPTPSNDPDPTPSDDDPTPSPPGNEPTPSPSDDPSPSPEVTPTELATASPEPSPTLIIIEEEEIPRGGPNEEVDQSTDEVVPNIDTLPKTGESSPIPYYLLGGFMAVSGLIALRSRKHQRKE